MFALHGEFSSLDPFFGSLSFFLLPLISALFVLVLFHFTCEMQFMLLEHDLAHNTEAILIPFFFGFSSCRFCSYLMMSSNLAGNVRSRTLSVTGVTPKPVVGSPESKLKQQLHSCREIVLDRSEAEKHVLGDSNAIHDDKSVS